MREYEKRKDFRYYLLSSVPYYLIGEKARGFTKSSHPRL